MESGSRIPNFDRNEIAIACTDPAKRVSKATSECDSVSDKTLQATDEYIRWGEDGTSFFVLHHEDFARDVLPHYFKHSNFSSFVRQLNMYGFHKVPHILQGTLAAGNNPDEEWEFMHPNFMRGRPDLLAHVKRKPSRPEKNSKDSSDNITENSSAITTAVPNVARPSLADFKAVLNEIGNMRRAQLQLASDLLAVQRENQMLWQESIVQREQHRKQQETVDKILRFLASIFASNKLQESNSVSKNIPNKRRRYLLENSPMRHSDPSDLITALDGKSSSANVADLDLLSTDAMRDQIADLLKSNSLPGNMNATLTAPLLTEQNSKIQPILPIDHNTSVGLPLDSLNDSEHLLANNAFKPNSAAIVPSPSSTDANNEVYLQNIANTLSDLDTNIDNITQKLGLKPEEVDALLEDPQDVDIESFLDRYFGVPENQKHQEVSDEHSHKEPSTEATLELMPDSPVDSNQTS